MGEENSYRIRLSRGKAGREHLPEGEERKGEWERVGTQVGIPVWGSAQQQVRQLQVVSGSELQRCLRKWALGKSLEKNFRGDGMGEV